MEYSTTQQGQYAQTEFNLMEIQVSDVKILLARVSALNPEEIYNALRITALDPAASKKSSPITINMQRISFMEYEGLCPQWADPHRALGAMWLLHSPEFWNQLCSLVLTEPQEIQFFSQEISERNHNFFGRFNSYFFMSCLLGSEWKSAVLDPHSETDTIQALLEDAPVTPADTFDELLKRMKTLFGRHGTKSSYAYHEASRSGAFVGKHYCAGIAITQAIYTAYRKLLDDPEYIDLLKNSVVSSELFFLFFLNLIPQCIKLFKRFFLQWASNSAFHLFEPSRKFLS